MNLVTHDRFPPDTAWSEALLHTEEPSDSAAQVMHTVGERAPPGGKLLMDSPSWLASCEPGVDT